MDKILGQEYDSGIERRDFLNTNCDSVESLGYVKTIPCEELNDLKDRLV